jgi:hypothetical protein
MYEAARGDAAIRRAADVFMENSLYLCNGGVVGKNDVAYGHDQLGFGAFQMGAAVGNNSIGTFWAVAESAITHDAMKWHPDR